MKAKQLRTHVAALMILAPAAALLSIPTAAIAQQRVAPRIESLAVNSGDGLRAGAELDFTLRATARASASLSLGNTDIVVPLRETAAGSGNYRGTYTVRVRDRIDPTALITATVTRNGVTSRHNFTYPAGFQALAMGNAPAAPVSAAPGLSQAPVPTLRIEQFTVTPVGRMQPGGELHYRVQSAPGGRAVLEIPGVADNIQMRETSPGVYEGRYTIRQRDELDAFDRAMVTLRQGNQVVTARLSAAVVPVARERNRDNTPPVVTITSPRPGEVISREGREVVAGTFDDGSGRGVNPDSVRLSIGGRDVTGETRVTPHEFSYRGQLPPGRYTAELTARDYAGNAVQRSWNFEVAGGPVFSAAPIGPLPLMVNTPANNAVMDANGNLWVQGRTAPFAMVTVRVDAVPPVIGQLFGVAQTVATETVRADRDGLFSVNVRPRSIGMPNTRYEVSLTANNGSQTAEQRLTVFQRG